MPGAQISNDSTRSRSRPFKRRMLSCWPSVPGAQIERQHAELIAALQAKDAELLAEHAGRADIERQHARLIVALQAKDAELLAERAGRADIERQHAELIAALQAKDAELLADYAGGP